MAISHRLDPDVIENIYRIMMNYFIQEQLELLKKKPKIIPICTERKLKSWIVLFEMAV